MIKLTSIRIAHYSNLIDFSWFYTLIKILILYGIAEDFFIRILLIIIMCIHGYFIIKSILSVAYNYTKNIFTVALIIDILFFYNFIFL